MLTYGSGMSCRTPDAGPVAGEESWADLADRARFRLRRAIASGRAAEAASWMRVHERLRALVVAEAAESRHGPDLNTENEPEIEPGRDRMTDSVADIARQIGTVARRAAHDAVDEASLDGLEAQIATLEARLGALGDDPAAADPAPALDSLDPVFSPPREQEAAAPEQAPPPDLATLMRYRQHRLELGLGVSDLDEALAALDAPSAEAGLSP